GCVFVPPKIPLQPPVHRLDAPVAADRFAEPFAAEIACADVVAHFARLRAVVMLGESKCVADRLDPWPILFGTEITRRLREKIGAFVLAAVSRVAGLVKTITEILQG